MFLALFSAALPKTRVFIRSLGAISAVTATIFTLAHYLLEPARMMGEISGVLNGALHVMLASSNVAAAASLRVLGLCLLVFHFATKRHSDVGLGSVGATLVVVSFALVGHTAAHDMRWLLVVLLICHLLIIALWFGALLPLSAAEKREPVEDFGLVVVRFSAVASRLVPAVFVAGIIMSIVLLGSIENLWTPYGTAVLIKVGGFALLMGLAAWNKLRLGPSIAAGNTAAASHFRISVITEWWLIVTILLITAIMTGLFSPTH